VPRTKTILGCCARWCCAKSIDKFVFHTWSFACFFLIFILYSSISPISHDSFSDFREQYFRLLSRDQPDFRPKPERSVVRIPCSYFYMYLYPCQCTKEAPAVVAHIAIVLIFCGCSYEPEPFLVMFQALDIRDSRIQTALEP